MLCSIGCRRRPARAPRKSIREKPEDGDEYPAFWNLQLDYVAGRKNLRSTSLGLCELVILCVCHGEGTVVLLQAIVLRRVSEVQTLLFASSFYLLNSDCESSENRGSGGIGIRLSGVLFSLRSPCRHFWF